MIFSSVSEKARKHPLLGVLALLFLLEVAWVSWAASQPAAAPLTLDEEAAGASVALSEITGPTIGGEAAFAALCESLPLHLWLFILAAFVLLLAYNLSAVLQTEAPGDRPVWRFELLLLLVTLLAWCAWDGCRSYPWFPFASVKFALILYAGYLLLRQERDAHPEPLQKEALF